MFGITLTPGHLIVGALLIVLYDAVWTFVFTNAASTWWFERLQGLLKLAIYAGFVALVILLSVTPWPWNLVLVSAVVLCVVFFSLWYNRRRPGTGSLKISITGLNRMQAQVTVTGPGNFTRSVDRGIALQGLKPGQYIITAADVASAGSQTLHPTVDNGTVTVTAGQTTTVKITYA